MSKAIFRSTGVVGAMTLVSRVLALVRDVQFARAFGAGSGMDVFLVAQMIPNLGRRMFAEGAFSQAFVPVFTATKTTGTHDDARDLMAVVMGTLGGVLSIVTIIGCLAAPLLLWLFASGFAADPTKSELGADLLRWTFPYLMFISLTSLAGGVLNAYGKFAVPAITPVILNLCFIAAVFVDASSVRVLAYAVFVAGILQFAFQLPALLQLRMLPWPRWAWSDPRVKRVVSLMIPVLIGSSVAQISLLLNTNLSTHLGDGPVSWLYYSNRLMEFPLGIFSIAIGTAILPALSAQHAVKSTAHFSATLDWSLRMITVIGLPAAVGMILLAGPMVATIYGGGHFTGEDVRMTTYALWAYGVGFLGFSLVKVLVPGFYARHEMKLPVRFAITSLIIGMTLSVGLFVVHHFIKFEAPHVVLAASTSLTACINAGLLFRRLRKDGVYAPEPGWAIYATRVGAATAVMTALVLLFGGSLSLWQSLHGLEKVFRLAVVIVGAIAAYFGVLLALGLRPRHLSTRP
ncbi:MAG: murein biosynthesis integral membrane protein MurJ [Gammaproteobacteria bacterium]